MYNRLAHQNLKYVKTILNNKNIRYIDDTKNFVCEKCLAGKQQRVPYPPSESRANDVLQLVHADVWGPMERSSLGGARYFLVIEDDFSSYRHVYFMKAKSEVKNNIEEFLLKAERETNRKLKVFRSDNGLEFVNQEVK